MRAKNGPPPAPLEEGDWQTLAGEIRTLLRRQEHRFGAYVEMDPQPGGEVAYSIRVLEDGAPGRHLPWD